jgi:hypothetical protein
MSPNTWRALWRTSPWASFALSQITGRAKHGERDSLTRQPGGPRWERQEIAAGTSVEAVVRSGGVRVGGQRTITRGNIAMDRRRLARAATVDGHLWGRRPIRTPEVDFTVSAARRFCRPDEVRVSAPTLAGTRSFHLRNEGRSTPPDHVLLTSSGRINETKKGRGHFRLLGRIRHNP